MSGDLKVGDVCVVALPSPRCAQCQEINGRECVIREIAAPSIRLGCNGTTQLGIFYVCEINGITRNAALHRTELRKKDPPKDDSAPRSDFTPADGDFVQDLQRRLQKEHA